MPAPAREGLPSKRQVDHVATTKGLVASDWLTVEKETGEWNGDEPVMVTVRVEAVSGKKGSTRVSLVNSTPGEIGSGVDERSKIKISDHDGDVWLNNVQPLTFDDVTTAVRTKSEVHVPVVMTVTAMMEGDFSPAANMADLGEILADHVRGNIAPTIENLHIRPTSVDPAKEVEAAKAVKAALDEVTAKARPGSHTVTTLALQRIKDWEDSFGDPDDLVGLGVTALVPVADDLAPIIEMGGGASAMKLEANYTKAFTSELHIPLLYKGNVETRAGLLMPPSTFDGRPQSWTTTYQGSYLENNWARYKVDTQAWPVVNW